MSYVCLVFAPSRVYIVIVVRYRSPPGQLSLLLYYVSLSSMNTSRACVCVCAGRVASLSYVLMSLTKFRKWLIDNGVSCDGLSFESERKNESVRGTYTILRRSFAKGDLIATIPKKIVLSVRNSSIAPLLERIMTEQQVSLSVCLNAAVMQERALGIKSKWHGYLSTIPQYEPLPLTWSSDELSRLRGTGLDEEARRMRRALLTEHCQLVAALDAHGEPKQSPLRRSESYIHAATLTSSRAFYIDEWHGEALVPLADMLNHKAALVPDDAVVEGEDDLDDEGDSDEDKGEGVATFAVGRVVSERRRAAARLMANVWGVSVAMDTTLHNIAEEEEEEDEDEEEEADEEVDEDEGEHQAWDDRRGGLLESDQRASDDVALVALRDLNARDEVFNTYGEHGNRTLLRDYGFTVSHNPLDYAELPWSVVCEAVAEAVPGGARWLRLRQRSLRTSECGVCFSELIDAAADGDEVSRVAFTFGVDGTPSSELLYVLWLLLAEPSKQPLWMSAPPFRVSGSDNVQHRDYGTKPTGVSAAVVAAREFIEAPIERQLEPPTPLLVQMVDVLSAAVRSHAAKAYPKKQLSPSHGGDGVGMPDAQLSGRSAQAATVVGGELAIWNRALSFLVESSTTSRRTKKQRA